MLFRSGRLAALALTLSALVACSSSDSSDSSPKGFKCQVSSANSGGLCQVNFFCDGGDGPAAYCDSTGKCACGPAAQNPKEFTSAGICDLEMNERATVANRECGFGM